MSEDTQKCCTIVFHMRKLQPIDPNSLHTQQADRDHHSRTADRFARCRLNKKFLKKGDLIKTRLKMTPTFGADANQTPFSGAHERAWTRETIAEAFYFVVYKQRGWRADALRFRSCLPAESVEAAHSANSARAKSLPFDVKTNRRRWRL